MLCENCRRREAKVHYTENINGITRELNLCEECSQKLGITDSLSMSMPVDFSNLFGSLLEDFESINFKPVLNEVKQVRCDNCGTTFEDIVNTGMMGCGNCYDVFSKRLDPILKRIQGANRHVGRIGKISDNKIEMKDEKEIKSENSFEKLYEKPSQKSKIEELQEELKKAIKDERYEDAAKIRDEIKEEEKNK